MKSVEKLNCIEYALYEYICQCCYTHRLTNYIFSYGSAYHFADIYVATSIHQRPRCERYEILHKF